MWHSLSPRQSQVAELVAQGWNNQQIAAELNIKVATVKTHIERIFEKLGAHHRSAVGALIQPHWTLDAIEAVVSDMPSHVRATALFLFGKEEEDLAQIAAKLGKSAKETLSLLTALSAWRLAKLEKELEKTLAGRPE